MRHLAISLFLVLFLAGCAGVSTTKIDYGRRDQTAFMAVNEFASRYGFKASYNTLDDIVLFTAKDKEIKLVLNSAVGFVNGSSFYLKTPPFYSKGKVFVPSELGQIVFSKEFTVFKPAFNIRTVLIDPGHGGRDPGAISAAGLAESDINLKIAKYLKNELQSKKINAVLTRNSDTFLELQDRVDLAKHYNADIFVSIHANANNSKSIRGVEVYYLSPARLENRQRALDLAKDKSLELRNLDFDAKTIVWDLRLTKNYSLSVELAHIMFSAFDNLGFDVKPPRKAPYYVLRKAYVPSILVEVGYLTNKYEEKILRKTYYQQHLARTIAEAIVRMNKKYGSQGN